MSWKERMKEYGGGDLAFLSSDGECLVFAVAADPVLLQGQFKGEKQERIGCPIITDEGFELLIIGKRAARKISKFEDKFKTNALMIVRHGEASNSNTTYDVSVYDNDVVTDRLLKMVKREYKPELLTQAIKDAAKCMTK